MQCDSGNTCVFACGAASAVRGNLDELTLNTRGQIATFPDGTSLSDSLEMCDTVCAMSTPANTACSYNSDMRRCITSTAGGVTPDDSGHFEAVWLPRPDGVALTCMHSCWVNTTAFFVQRDFVNNMCLGMSVTYLQVLNCSVRRLFPVLVSTAAPVGARHGKRGGYIARVWGSSAPRVGCLPAAWQKEWRLARNTKSSPLHSATLKRRRASSIFVDYRVQFRCQSTSIPEGITKLVGQLRLRALSAIPVKRPCDLERTRVLVVLQKSETTASTEHISSSVHN